MSKLIILILTILLTSCDMEQPNEITGFSEPLSGQSFNLPVPSSAEGSKYIWGTYYYLPRYEAVNGGYALRDSYGRHMGVELSQHDWCFGALEGSFQVHTLQGTFRTFNYHRSGQVPQVNCSSYFSTDVSRSRFIVAKGLYGDGVNGYKLVPYRSIAVDSSVIPVGTVLYVPMARGVRITLDSGESVEHDGYFFAADKGGAIQGDHIDVFIGRSTENPFEWIRSRSDMKVKAYIIGDQQVTDYLRKLHL